jgi:N6-L-threonylcarbamoyladenine synthase
VTVIPTAVVLGIETSCDETAVALVAADRRVLAAPLVSQLAEHAPYGGIVPELAARAHLARLDRLIGRALAEAGLALDRLDGVAVTTGPGLIGGLLVGSITAKMLALAKGLPLLAINHLAAHALTARFLRELAFPYLVLLVSGGHALLLVAEDVDRFRRYGTTLDDAFGEAFDKVAKMLGLGFPGGPAVERLALDGDPGRFALPRPLLQRPGCDFSLSGLKTAVRTLVLELGPRAAEPVTMADLCASFQAAVGDILVDRCRHAIDRFRRDYGRVPVLAVVGGVAANRAIGAALAALAATRGIELLVPPPQLCTDNAVMVAWAGLERLARGLTDPLTVSARARWPLDPDAAPLLGAGAKGAKA